MLTSESLYSVRRVCVILHQPNGADHVSGKDYFKADCYRTEHEEDLPKQIHPIHFRAEKEEQTEYAEAI